MATDKLAKVLEHTRRAVLRHDVADLTDGQLMGSFLSRQDGAAFEALVRRHGPMVLGVCRRVAGNLHDAEDAFQATFLVLACKAATVEPLEAVGNWLYGVAYRVASKIRSRAARRRARERQVNDMPRPEAEPPLGRQELELLLDQELNRLPDKYRLPIVLCDLEGWTRREAARQLGLPDGTLSNRLATGRRMLATRLSRRGLPVVGGAASAMLIHQSAAPACVPPPLLLATVRAATLVAAGNPAPLEVSARVAALLKGERKTMLLTRLKLATGALLVVTLVGLARSGGPAPPLPSPAQGTATTWQAGPPNKGFPAWTNAKAYVQRDGATGLRVRAELPVGRFLKLLDADGKAVHLHEFVNWQPPPFTVDLKDVRVFDTRGRARREKEWTKGLTGETLVLLEFRDGDLDAKQLADALRLYREDLAVLVLPPAAIKELDISKAFAPAKSLPQVFPGAKPAPGGPVPPPK
jgi:RNA polymerase sigma factor (sigma-70 family)